MNVFIFFHSSIQERVNFISADLQHEIKTLTMSERLHESFPTYIHLEQAQLVETYDKSGRSRSQNSVVIYQWRQRSTHPNSTGSVLCIVIGRSTQLHLHLTTELVIKPVLQTGSVPVPIQTVPVAFYDNAGSEGKQQHNNNEIGNQPEQYKQ